MIGNGPLLTISWAVLLLAIIMTNGILNATVTENFQSINAYPLEGLIPGDALERQEVEETSHEIHSKKSRSAAENFRNSPGDTKSPSRFFKA